MPVPKIAKPRLLTRLIRNTYPCTVNQLFSSPHAHSSLFSKPICSKTHALNSHPSLPLYHKEIVDGLILIFTQRPFCPESQELKDFGSRLTRGIVEDVLKRFKSWKRALLFFNWASNQPGYRHNCYTYNVMAEILSYARQNAPLRLLAKDLANSRCWMTPGALGFFVRCLGNHGMVEEANELFDQIKKVRLCTPNNYSYNCLLEAISKSSSVELIEKRLNEMHQLGWQLDKYALTPLLKCYCNAGKFEKALDVFNQMYKQGWVDGHVLSILVLAFSKWGEVDKAFELIETMEEFMINLNEKTFFILIHGFVKESRIDKAFELLDKMQRLGFVPDIAVYDVLICGLCKNKEIEKALHLFLQMKELGIRPDVKILAELISSLPEETQMIQLVETRHEDLDVEARSLLFNSFLKGLVNNGSIEKAYHLLRVVIGDESSGDLEEGKPFPSKEFVHPDTTSFEIVITGLCQINKLDVALGLFRDMDQICSKRSQLLYNNVIDCLSHSNRLEECYELLSEMKDCGFKPTPFTHNAIFGCLCRKEDAVGALDMVREMRMHGHEPWIKYSTMLVKKLCKHGRAAEACNFLAKMVREGFLLDIVPYSAAIDGFIKINELDKALELFGEIYARGYCPDVVAYNIIINGLCRAKRIVEAQDFLREMLEKGLIPSVVTYNLLIDGWCKNGDIDQAMLCLARMVGKEREPNVITYTTLVDGLFNAGRPDDAIKLWNEMEGRSCSPNRIAFMAVINGLCKCGKADDALVYLHAMEEKEMNPDTYIYVSLIDAFISNSSLTLAFEILKQMACRGNFQDLNNKNHLIVKNAITKLSEDVTTSSSVKNLLAEGSIPSNFSVTVDGSEGPLSP